MRLRLTLKKSIISTYILLFTALTFLHIFLRQTQSTNTNQESANSHSGTGNLFFDIFSQKVQKEEPLPLFPEDSLITDRILEQLKYSPENSTIPRHPVKIFLPQGKWCAFVSKLAD